MARQRGAAACGKKPKTVFELGCQSVYPKGRDARRGKFDRQRDAVEAAANSGDRGRYACVRRNVRGGLACPLAEQADGAVAQRVFALRTIFRGNRERRDPSKPPAPPPGR